ncbi:MAG: hypothetical protein HFF69_06250 [Oscillospiraceae bacterium]|nr:hypothetical protein [Oscillospiraceae bacterium]
MTSSQIDEFLAYLRDCEQRFRMAEADELEANAITNDIHHDMEFVEHDDAELLVLAVELTAARKKRRAAKDAMAETAPVLAWLEENRKTVKSLEQLLGAVRRAERAAENRIYTPRRR